MLAPIRPAMVKVSGLPPAVIQIGGVGWTGGGKILTLISRPSPLVAGTDSPRHSAPDRLDAAAGITAWRLAKFSGARAKSLACQPEANDSPTRPFDRLSTTDHSSAHADRVVERQHARCRHGCCMRSVTIADRRAGDRRVGVEAAERVEVALGRPDGGEAVLVGEPRAVEQQLVPVAPLGSAASAAK